MNTYEAQKEYEYDAIKVAALEIAEQHGLSPSPKDYLKVLDGTYTEGHIETYETEVSWELLTCSGFTRGNVLLSGSLRSLTQALATAHEKLEDVDNLCLHGEFYANL